MKIRTSITLVTLLLGFLAITTQGCGDDCEQVPLFESDDYVLVEPPREVFLEEARLVGSQLHVDRAARVATIRYVSEGTTYEVRYTLDW